jgi:hypothetical protein
MRAVATDVEAAHGVTRRVDTRAIEQRIPVSLATLCSMFAAVAIMTAKTSLKLV